jgi:hypothetical protein
MAANRKNSSSESSTSAINSSTLKERLYSQGDDDDDRETEELVCGVVAGSGDSQQGPPPQGCEPDLFSILSSMHLTNQMGGGQGGAVTHPVLVASRKRKILDAGNGSSWSGGSGKINGMKPPAMRRNSDTDEEEEPQLQTPQCSQTGIIVRNFRIHFKFAKQSIFRRREF